jgi:hypothetical protein
MPLSDLASVAAGLGLYVFPCDVAKRPCVKGGFTSASKDPAEIKRMFSAPGTKMIGVPTGSTNNLIVIDVDIKNAARGMEWLELNREALPETRTHKTRSGGLHLLFIAPDGVEIRNSASRVAPGVDVRGEGGYVIVPPSEGYQVADPTDPAEMPIWLIKACLKQEERYETRPSNPLVAGDGTPYGIKALENACANIQNAPEGQKHDTLNREAYSIGGLVAAGEVVQSVAYAELSAALQSVRHKCDDFKGALKTLHSAFGDGMASPRTVSHIAPRQQVYVATPEPGPAPKDPKPEPLEQFRKADGSLKYFTFDEAVPDLDARDFVEGLLLEGAMSVVYGESNSGKTFWTTDLAIHVAAGRPWNGREVDLGGVLYLALEGGHGIKNRIAAFKIENDMEDARIPFGVVPVSLNLLDPNADADPVIKTVAALAAQFETPVKLIVVDTLSRAFSGGNENASEDMGALVTNGDKIRQLTKAHVLWIHHSGKDAAKGARGHSLLRAATDTEIEITAEGESRQADVRKQRDLPKGDVFNFKLKPVTLGQNRRDKDVTSCVIENVESDQAASAANDRRKSLKGHNKRAFEVLTNLIASSGASGHGAPPGCVSVPDKWWRANFFDSAMPGENPKVKQNAFKRASDHLIEQHFVGMIAGRVWIVKPDTESYHTSDSTEGYTS